MTAAAAPFPTRRRSRSGDRQIGLWLLTCCAMVLGMISLGGVTRLTGSGLSMVEWRPVLGFLPPLSEAEWQRVFALYQGSPEFRAASAGIGLAGFKSIFWWEFVHRLWGRLIGVVFLVPFLWFVLRRQVDRGLALRLGGFFVVGGLQGVLGWYMVRSGLVDVPEVSQYRLVAHLGLALLIYVLMLWTALGLLWPRPETIPDRRLQTARWLALSTVGVVALTLLSGGFMAGTHAGWTFNTFPLMDGALVPAGYFSERPWYLSPFEHIETIQFNHRLLAIA
ncbi:MAG: heme A synthase, partial [bacterium]|nr:heme A synthase [bacterium]